MILREHNNIPSTGKPLCAAAGFTLAEIMVVLVILSIAALVIVPAAIDAASVQAISAARMVASDIEYAQSAAITYQKPISVVFKKSENLYRIVDANTSQVLVHPINKSDYEVLLGQKGGFEQVSISSADFGGSDSSELTFNEFGEPIDGSGWVQIQAGAHLYKVKVAAATGIVSVTDISP